jgi:hypothetical protein
MKKLLKKLAGIKTLDLDNDGKIESLHDEITGLLSGFKNIYDKVNDANNKLINIMEEEEAIAIKAEHRIERARAEYEANENLKKRVSDFIY